MLGLNYSSESQHALFAECQVIEDQASFLARVYQLRTPKLNRIVKIQNPKSSNEDLLGDSKNILNFQACGSHWYVD